MKIVAIIPARGGSKGIPRKNVIPFCGKPLLQWTIEQAKESKILHDVYVSTESGEIFVVANDLGATVIKRPNKLATDTATTAAVMMHALTKIDADVIVLLQPTSPLRKPGDIDKAIELLCPSPAMRMFDCVISCSIEKDVCLWNSTGVPVTFDPYRRLRRQDKPGYYLENGSIYVFTRELFESTDNYIGGEKGFFIQESWQSFELDDEDSLAVCELFMRRKLNGQGDRRDWNKP